jgi:hypothetical protein
LGGWDLGVEREVKILDGAALFEPGLPLLERHFEGTAGDR